MSAKTYGVVAADEGFVRADVMEMDSSYCIARNVAPEDARRIRAALNACRHLTTEQLEAGDLDYAGCSTLAGIRAALGVGDKPMLSDLPKIVREVREQAGRDEKAALKATESARVLRRAMVWWRNRCRAHNERREALRRACAGHLELAERATKAEAELESLKKEVIYILDHTPGAVRVHEGLGPENIAASLAITVSKIKGGQG